MSYSTVYKSYRKLSSQPRNNSVYLFAKRLYFFLKTVGSRLKSVIIDYFQCSSQYLQCKHYTQELFFLISSNEMSYYMVQFPNKVFPEFQYKIHNIPQCKLFRNFSRAWPWHYYHPVIFPGFSYGQPVSARTKTHYKLHNNHRTNFPALLTVAARSSHDKVSAAVFE